MFLTSFIASAQFIEVKEKFCDGKSVELKKGERLFFDQAQSVFGVGKTDDENCKSVEFFHVVLSSKVGDSEETYSSVSNLGKRNSCGVNEEKNSENWLEAFYISSSKVVIQVNEDNIQHIGCTQISYNL